jgi:hypothetical protein
VRDRPTCLRAVGAWFCYIGLIESRERLLVLTPIALAQAAADANDSIAAAAPNALESVVVDVPATPAESNNIPR